LIVLDTTVLVYASGVEHPLREPARSIIRSIEAGTVDATTSVAVIQEFAHVYGRRRDRARTASLARDHATMLAPLLPLSPRHVESALALFERHSSLDSFDSFLAAAAISSVADALVSADHAFAEVEELPFVDLAGPELEALLS
jgi:predicted nucleic acid-binding protein